MHAPDQRHACARMNAVLVVCSKSRFRYFFITESTESFKQTRDIIPMSDDGDDTQTKLAALWHGGQRGNLSPWSEAKVWALREVYQDTHEGKTWGLYTYIAGKVEKIGGGSPSREAIRQLCEKMEEDPEWFPGKRASMGGRPRSVSAQNEAVIARSAVALKKAGIEPTFALVAAQCPNASLNPATGERIDKKRIYSIMKERCYDETPDQPWKHRPRLSKTLLTAEDMQRRMRWAESMKSLRHTPAWYVKHLIWTDICNDILPRTPRKATLQAQARKGGKGWISEGSQMKAVNLRGPKESLKQSSWDTIRMWWIPILLRDRLHVEVLGSTFPGENPEGAAILVEKVRTAVNIRVHGVDKPNKLFVDRGRGFYHPSTGKITNEFADALRAHGLEAFYGRDASVQPGNMQELMLHETAVAWIRKRLQAALPKKPWEESEDGFKERMRNAVSYVNSNHDVAGLCKELPSRIDKLLEAEGGKLKK